MVMASKEDCSRQRRKNQTKELYITTLALSILKRKKISVCTGETGVLREQSQENFIAVKYGRISSSNAIQGMRSNPSETYYVNSTVLAMRKIINIFDALYEAAKNLHSLKKKK